MLNSIIYTFTLVFYFHASIESIDISPCAKWDPNGKTVAGTGISGAGATELSMPKGIFMLKRTNTLYVADFGNQRVQMFSLNTSHESGTTVAFGIDSPSKIYVDEDDDGPSIYISVFIGNRVEKWTKGALKGIQLGDECRSCFGIAVDEEKNVYMSESDRQRVIKWSPKTNLTVVVAGRTDERGSGNEYLSTPDGLYFDRTTDDLYVADSGNARIQKWGKNALTGIEVAGSNWTDWAHDTEILASPNGVWVDEQTKIVYISDTIHHRIMRWMPGALVGVIIAGGNGEGNASNQFNTPTDLTFDREGNLYVCDNWNHQIQMFSIIENKPCHPSSIGSSLYCNRYMNWIMIITILSIVTWIVEKTF
ncbi:hypothetical protein I4U23_005178 [Adineta vaga]|nr:hypothetical protein I4U23_005178 [Adineta vaga]